MGSVSKHLFRVGAAAALGLPLLLACETNNQSLFIRGALGGQGGGSTTGCTFAPGGSFVPNPILDIAFLDTYVAQFEVQSQFVTRENKDVPRAESNRVVISGGEVRVTDGVGGSLGAFTTLVSSSVIDPVNSGVVPVTVISPDISARLRNELKVGERRQVVAFVRVFGQTLGNKDIESGEYQLVLTVTRGGLVSFPPDLDDPTIPGRDCSLPPKTTTPSTACLVGQDDPVVCSECRARLGTTNPVCVPPP